MKALIKSALLASAAALMFAAPMAQAQSRPSFKIGYVVYVGFMPWVWAKNDGILQKWSDKYGIDIELVQINDYVGAVNQFIAGDLDAVAMAGMDALTMPAAAGVDTSIFLMHDYSNGNDALLSRSAPDVASLVGEEVWLLQYSVSHYLLARALQKAGIDDPAAVKTSNISDTEIAAAYLTQPTMAHAAAWNPAAAEMVAGVEGTKVIFDSSDIPGEIMDVLVGNTEVMAKSPEFGKAVTGAWYETLAVMNSAENAALMETLASAMGTDLAGLKLQIDSTKFLNTPAEALEFMTSQTTYETMDLVRKFSFDQGLFGAGASSPDDIGIQLGDGRVLGDESNIKLRFEPLYAKLGAEGAL